jgi:hypothetical protein
MGDTDIDDVQPRESIPLRWDGQGRSTDALRGVLNMYVYEIARTWSGVLNESPGQ